MGRPKTKDELLALSQKNYSRLMELVDSYSPIEKEREFRPGTMNRNIRDVLAHLHHWHLLMLDWYAVGMEGGKPEMPAKGYTWRTTSELNRWILEKYKDLTLWEAVQMLEDSFGKIQAIIRLHSNEELFEKKRYHWTGSTSLGAYLISATSSHYDWAFKLIRKGKK